MKASIYQEAIYDYVKNGTGSMAIKAVAGAGKTTTCVESAKLLPKKSKILFLAFNRLIAEDLQKKVPKNTKATTIHSYGYYALKRLDPNMTMNEHKVYQAIEDYYNKRGLDRLIEPDEISSFFRNAEKIINYMRLTLSCQKEDCEEIVNSLYLNIESNQIDYIYDIFKNVVADKKQYDFTDMIFIPATNKIDVPKFDVIFVDEFQDVSKAQYEFIKKLLKRKGRLFIVGDPNQSIYGYLGSDVGLFQEVVVDFEGKELPLSISYRCGKSIVDKAKTLVSDIQHAEDAPDGVIVKQGSFANIQEKDMVLCRINAPLVSACLKLWVENKRAYVKGKDVGAALIAFVSPLKKFDIPTALEKIEKKRQKVEEKLRRKFPYYDLDKIPDYVAFLDKKKAVEFLAGNSQSVEEIIEKAKKMFSDVTHENAVTLSSVHKAKGLESDRVFILEPQLLPWPNVKNEEQTQQEKNVEYVAITRAKTHLEYVVDFTTYSDKDEAFSIENYKKKL